MLMDSRVKATHMTAKPGTRNVLPEALPYHNFTPVVVSFGKLKVVLVSIYLKVGLGLSSGLQDILGDIAAWLSLVSLPWIILGDWNLEPGEIRSSPWLSFVGGKVVVPSNVSFTRSSGQEGRSAPPHRPWVSGPGPRGASPGGGRGAHSSRCQAGR